MNSDVNTGMTFKLGTVALWSLLTKRKVIKANDQTFDLIKTYATEQFNHLVKQPLPATMEVK